MILHDDYNKNVTESVVAWWHLAGVDYVTDGKRMDWLAQAEDSPAPATHVEPTKTQPVAPVAPPQLVSAEWPTDLIMLKAMIKELPGSNYGPRALIPQGEAGATAMVVSDFPEEEEISAGQYGAGPVGQLLKNIMLAAQIIPELTYHTALAPSRPAAASLPRQDLPALAACVRHQIALVQPKIIILFGAAACEALLAQELMQARGILHYINYDDRKVAAIATFHPRTLIAQPQLKAQTWSDMQMLVRKDYL
jgi:uracil-DNA glycosylase